MWLGDGNGGNKYEEENDRGIWKFVYRIEEGSKLGGGGGSAGNGLLESNLDMVLKYVYTHLLLRS